MAFVRVAATSDIPAGSMKKVSAGGEDILVANVGGAYSALANKCPHAGGSLAEGTLDGSIVTCPKHGAQFDVTSGKAVGKAKVVVFRVTPKDAKTYATRVEGSDILVDVP
jgi:3-phenylpropionate/trans-cinnamate dioxygenase ferredoxin subunit